MCSFPKIALWNSHEDFGASLLSFEKSYKAWDESVHKSTVEDNMVSVFLLLQSPMPAWYVPPLFKKKTTTSLVAEDAVKQKIM
jgi:hypothetical protein